MRPMLEEAQQTLPKSVDNDVLESMIREGQFSQKSLAALARSFWLMS